MTTPLDKFTRAIQEKVTDNIPALAEFHFKFAAAPRRALSRRRPRWYRRARNALIPADQVLDDSGVPMWVVHQFPNLLQPIRNAMERYGISFYDLMQQFGHWAAIMGPLYGILNDLPAASLVAIFLMAINTMVVYTNRTLESETEPRYVSRREREQNPDQTREEFIMERCNPVNYSAAEWLRGKEIYDLVNQRPTGERVPEDFPDIVNALDTYSPTLFNRLEHGEMSYEPYSRGPRRYVQERPYLKTNEDGQPLEKFPFMCLRCKAIKRDGDRCINIIKGGTGEIFCGTHRNMRTPPREAQGWAVDRDGLVFDDTDDGNVSDAPTEEQSPLEYVKHNLRF